MQNKQLSEEELKHFSIVRLTHIYLLSEKLECFMSDQKIIITTKKNEILNNELLTLPDLISEAHKDGYTTIGEYLHLKEIEPDRFQKILEQSGLKTAKLWVELEDQLFQHLFPNLTWSSLFLISMSHLEYCLVLFCEYMAKQKKAILKLSDISGHSTYEKFILYNNKVIQNNYKFNKSILWSNIKNHQSVRNLLVHNNGLIDSTPKAITVKNIIESGNVNINWNSNMVLEFSKKYLEDVITDIQNWIIEYFN
ncbi:MAG: hypothetical protein V1720_20990, partial [bacterium]